MLKEWVSNKYLSDSATKKIKTCFFASKPYPNFTLHQFFEKSKILRLKKEISKLEFVRQDKDLFSFSNTRELASVENKIIKEFFCLISSNEFLRLIKKMTGKKNLAKIDMHAHLFGKGDYLLFHDDVVEGRAIAYIIYLSNLKEGDGGRLRLYNIKNPKKPVKCITPRFGSFACFKVSARSLHDVEEIKSHKSRLTVGGWFYGN